MIDSLGLTLPKKVKLSSTLTMHRRNKKIVLWYHKPNEDLFPEDYAHHMLILKINSTAVLNIVNRYYLNIKC